MTNEEAKKMLKAKLECLKRETSGINHDCNMRLCDGCSLNYEQGNMGEQKEALEMAIQALERQRNITNEELYQGFIELEAENERLHEVLEQQRWIPIKTRPLTEEEKEHYISIGWSEDSLDCIYNCPLPDDGQEVLITDSMGNVELDTFYSDDGYYFESNWDADDVIAWMPLPKPYKESDESETN